MKFLNFFKAFTLILISCFLLIFWYSSNTQEKSIAVDNPEESVGEEQIHEESLTPPYDFNEVADSISSIETNTLDAADRRVNSYLNSSSAKKPEAAYMAFSLISGEYLAYNPDLRITGASVIKSAYCFYILDGVSQGKFSLDEVLIYSADDKRNGTGIIKNSEIGTSYTVKELITLSITESDNVAHKMLVDRFGRNEFNKFIEDFDIESMHLYANGNTDYYTNLTARDLTRLFVAIHQKSFENDIFNWYLDIMKQAKYNRISNATEFDVAHKSGFMKGAFHDVGLIFADEPYIIVMLTNGNISEVEESFLSDLAAILCEYMEKKNP